MRPGRLTFRRASGVLLLGGLTALFAMACAIGGDKPAPSAPEEPEAATIPGPDGATDAPADAATQVCKEGRRRCLGLVLQVCDVGTWIELQTCVQGESCDVAVGICRTVEAGPDAAGDGG